MLFFIFMVKKTFIKIQKKCQMVF